MKRRPSGIRAVLRRHRAATVTATVALAVVIAAGAGELTARQMIQNRIAEAAPALGGNLTVGEGGDSALWDLATQRIPRLDIGSDDAQLGHLTHVSVRAQLDDVRLGGEAAMAGARAEVTVPTLSIGDAVRTAIPSMQVASVTTDPTSGTIAVVLGLGGAGKLTLRPEISDGRVSLSVADLTVFGRSVPPDRLGTAGSGLGSAEGPQRPYPLGLKATSVQVLPDSLRVTLEGGSGTLAGS